jgi:hypothetical protein
MKTAHQPGSEPLQIPEQIPNPAVQPRAPTPKPGREEPIERPEKAPANHAFTSSLHALEETEGAQRSPEERS